MSARYPVIKFSPFEALLIGEKNNILKRQPMKNTIFVTRLSQQSKEINLRDLFGVEKSTKTENNDVIFKIPQKVHDFFKNHKEKNKKAGTTKIGKNEILYYEFEGCKMITKNNKTVLPKGKNLIVRLNKAKFKQKFKPNDNIRHKAMKKFPNPTRKRSYCETTYKSLIKNKNTKKKNFNVKRHSLRGKDGKFICKKDSKKLNFQEISPKQKFLSNYLRQLYLKKNKQVFSSSRSRNNLNLREVDLPYSVGTIVGLPNMMFDITASETILNEVSKKYYESNCHEDFQFPKVPKHLEEVDFESDCNLLDIIFENFPKIVKFECQSEVSDFSYALLKSDILKHTETLRIYERKKNGCIKDVETNKNVKKQYPIIKFRRLNEIVPNLRPLKNGGNLYTSKIDEPFTKKSHLIKSKSFRTFFLQSAQQNDIFIENLIKPFFQNPWFGSLSES